MKSIIVWALALLAVIPTVLFAKDSDTQKVVSLSIGTSYSGTISLPGQQDRFTFPATSGQRFYFDTLDLDGESINVQLLTPRGITSWGIGHNSEQGPFYLDETGTYTLLVDGTSDVVGDYSFRLLNTANATSVSYGSTNAGQLSAQNVTTIYSFVGSTGQRIGLTNISASENNGSWRLVAPDDTLLLANGIAFDLGETVLPADGTYLILMEGSVDSTNTLSFEFKLSLVSNPSGSLNGWGTLRSGTTTTGSTNSFTYVAPAGTLVYFDSRTNTHSAYVQLLDPTGEQVFFVDGNYDAGPYRLARSGTYNLNVIGYGDGPFRFIVENLGTAALIMTNGGTYTQIFNAAYKSVFYRFTNSAPQPFYYDALDNDFDNVRMRLYHPNGSSIGWYFQNSDYDWSGTMLQPGVYYVIQDSQSEYTTNNSVFRWINPFQSPSTNLAFDTTINGAVDPGTKSDFYWFNATAGQRLFFDALATTPGGTWNVYRRDGSYATGGYLGGDFELIVPETGSYYIAAGNFYGDLASLPYSIRVSIPDITTVGYTLGTTVNGTLSEIGEEDLFTFSGAVGQQVYYDALDVGYDSIRVKLISPSGSTIPINGNSDTDAGPLTLVETGTYTISLKAEIDIVGDYSFRLMDVATVSMLNLDTTLNNTLTPRSRADLFRFTGSAGQRLYFDGASTNENSGGWWLYGPADQYIGSAWLGGDFVVNLPQSGNYFLAIGNGDTTNSLSYTVRVATPAVTTTALTIGNTYSNLFTKPGEEHRFTFSGSPGLRLFYDALDADSDSVNVSLVDPTGYILHLNHNSDSDVGPFTLLGSGTYTLIQQAVDDTAVMNYQFRILDVSAGPMISAGATVSGSIDPQLSTKLHRFTGSAGDRINVQSISASTNSANWVLYNPANSNLRSDNIENNLGDFVLSVSGTYVIAVQGNGTEPGALNFQFLVTKTNSLATPSGLVGWWPADGNANDIIGGNNGTLLGSANYATAVVAQGFNFEQVAVNDGVSIPHHASYDIQGAGFTAQFWMKSTGSQPEGDAAILDKSHGPGAAGWAFQNNGSMRFAIGNGSGFPEITSSSNVFDGNFHHIVGTWDGTNMRLYIDGTLAAGPLATGTPAGNGGTLNVGYVGFGGRHFLGIVDDVQIYNRALSSTEIASIYNAGDLGVTPPASGFGVVQSGTTTSGQTNTYFYSAPAGLPIFIDSLTGSGSPATYTLLDPAGNTVTSIDANFDNGPYALPISGTYTLHIVGQGDGPFSINVLDLTTSTNLTFGTQYATEMTAHRSDFFKFTGTNGQQIFYDGTVDGSYYLNAQLFSPSLGQVLHQAAHDDGGPITLDQSGTFYLRLYSYHDSATNYQFRILDATGASPLALDAIVGGGLTVVPANWLSITGSFVNVSLGDYFTEDDWRVSQTISGTRVETNINYTEPSWGTLDSVGLAVGANGSDFDWDYFSVQWDGTVTVTNPNTRLYLRTDDGGRMWIDVDNDGLFESPDEFVNRDWGLGADGFSYGSPALNAGTYSIRIQYEESSNANKCILFHDGGASVPAHSSLLYRFNGVQGQRLFFDSLYSSAFGRWDLINADNIYVIGGHLSNDFETTLAATGTYLLRLYSDQSGPIPFKFRIVTPNTTTNVLTLGATVNGALDEPAEEDYYSFVGTAGQRLYYDGLTDYRPVGVQLLDPNGTIVMVNTDSYVDVGPFTLTENGTYRLFFKPRSDVTTNYSFRLLDVASAAVAALDTVVTNEIAVPYGAVLYRFSGMSNLRLYVDHLETANFSAAHFAYSPNDISLGSTYFGNDIEFTPAQNGNYVLVLANYSADIQPYSFQIIPGNHAPVLTAIGNKTVNEQTSLAFTATATDLEAPNDQLTFTLDSGAPAGASINPTTGAFTWTPTEAQGPGVYTATIRVTDDGNPSFNDSETISITVNEINVAPSLTVPGNQTISELTALNVSASATDSDIPANSLTFALVNPPAGMTINTTSGAISWTPTEAQGPSTNTISVKVTDNNVNAVNAQQLSVTNTFVVTVNEVNVAPVLSSISNRTINELTALSVTNAATDADVPANTLSYTLLTAPAGALIDGSGVITWTPTEAQGPSTNTFTTRVTDNSPQAVNAQQLSATNTFTVTVNEVNSAPSITVPGNQTINELTTLSTNATATDPDIPANTLTFFLVSGPTGLTVNSSGAISWTPTEAQGPSTNTVTVRVVDNGSSALSATNSFTIVVNEINVAPVLTVPSNQTINELTTLTVTNSATDSDTPANTLTFAIVSAPAGVSINPTTGVLTWTPTEAQGPNTNTISVKVTDNNPQAVNTQQLSVTNSFQVVVNEVNVAPVLAAMANQTINELTALSVTNVATDADIPANTLTYSLLVSPTGASINSSGIISWTPSESQGPSTNIFTTRVVDNGSPNLSATNTFTIVVTEVNVAPVLSSIVNQTITELTALSVTNTATDADVPVNTLTYSLLASPTGASINSGGVISWTPSESQGPSTNTFTTRVVDNGSPNLSATNTFTIVVTEVNAAPVLSSIANQTISELTALSVTNTATDVDVPVNTLTYSLLASPTGASINAIGVISWTPSEAQGPSTNTFTTRVVDNGSPNLSATNTFTIVVTEVNVAPVLSAIANRTINPGQTLTFTNTATDSDVPANALTFTLVNPPTGVTLNASTGILTWRPTTAQANTTNTFGIRVTDNGSPGLNDTENFTVVVSPLTPVTLTPLGFSGGNYQISISGTAGPDYKIQASSSLTNWTTLTTNTPSSLPFTFIDSGASSTNKRFYRVLLGP